MTLTSRIRDNKAFYAAAGAGDLAVERLRQVPERLNKLQHRADAREFPGAAVSYVTHIGARAVEFYDEMAERGRKVVKRAGSHTRELEETPTPTHTRVGTTEHKTPTPRKPAADATPKKVAK